MPNSVFELYLENIRKFTCLTEILSIKEEFQSPAAVTLEGDL